MMLSALAVFSVCIELGISRLCDGVLTQIKWKSPGVRRSVVGLLSQGV